MSNTGALVLSCISTILFNSRQYDCVMGIKIFLYLFSSLGAIHPDAYAAYQTSHNLKSVVEKTNSCNSIKTLNNKNDKINIKLTLLTPILPMLVSFSVLNNFFFFTIIIIIFQAEACKNLDDVFKKCPDGIYSEIKYDGERVQLHKSEKEFKFFSRSLKPVLGHKVSIIDIGVYYI